MERAELEAIAKRAMKARQEGKWKGHFVTWGRYTQIFTFTGCGDVYDQLVEGAGIDTMEGVKAFLAWEKKQAE